MKIPVRSPFYCVYLLFLYALQMKKLYSVLISAALGACIISCSDTSRHESLHDQAHIETYKEAWRKFNTAGQDSALIAYTRPILFRALRQKDTLTALYCGTYMAQAWLFMEQTDSTAALLEQMRRDIARQDDNILKYLYWSICGGYAIKAELNYTKAMEYYSRSYEYSVASGDVSRQLGILMDIIYIFYIRSDGNGMKYAEQACSLAHNESMPLEDRCAADMMMAMMHHINGNDRTALGYIDSAADMAEKGGYLTLYPLIYKVYGDVWTSSARYSEAERYYSRALRYTGYTDAGIETMIYLDYGRMLQKAGDYGKAERILEQGLEISYRNDNHECRKELLSSLIDNALHSRDSLRLAALAGNYRAYLDSVSNLQREREFNSMLMSMQRVEYENIAQAAELEYLRSRQRLLANMAVLTLIAVVAIFLLILYRRQRNTYKLLVEKYQQYADQFNKEANIARYVPGGEPQQLTKYRQSVQYPSISHDGSRIVFLVDYKITCLDTRTGKVTEPQITVADNDTEMRRSFKDQRPAYVAVSPDGKKLALAVRGLLYISDAEGKYLKLMNTPADERVDEIVWTDNTTIY